MALQGLILILSVHKVVICCSATTLLHPFSHGSLDLPTIVVYCKIAFKALIVFFAVMKVAFVPFVALGLPPQKGRVDLPAILVGRGGGSEGSDGSDFGKHCCFVK